MDITQNSFETNLLITKIDNFEESLKKYKELEKEKKELEAEIKELMVKIGKENGLDKVKWTTPKGIQITTSIGKKPVYEEQIIKEFDLDTLKENYPDIYEKCFKDKKHNICIQNGSNDRLVITLPKEEK